MVKDDRVKNDIQNWIIKIVMNNLEESTDLKKGLIGLLAGNIAADFFKVIELKEVMIDDN